MGQFGISITFSLWHWEPQWEWIIHYGFGTTHNFVVGLLQSHSINLIPSDGLAVTCLTDRKLLSWGESNLALYISSYGIPHWEPLIPMNGNGSSHPWVSNNPHSHFQARESHIEMDLPIMSTQNHMNGFSNTIVGFSESQFRYVG